MDNEKIIVRVTSLGVLMAILFGILQYLPEDKTYSFFGVEAAMKVIVESFFGTGLLFVLTYVLFVAINFGYKGLEGSVPEKFLAIVYNAVVLVILFIIFITVGVGLFSNISLVMPILSSFLVLFFLLSCLVLFWIIFRKYVF